MPESEILHGTAVAIGGHGCLITGAAGSGKSTLALEMIALGAQLIADDRVDLARADQRVILSVPAPIAGLIEARGAGLIRMPHCDRITLHLIADLDHPAAERLPSGTTRTLLGVPHPVVFLRGREGRASVLMAILQHGLANPHEMPEAAHRGLPGQRDD